MAKMPATSPAAPELPALCAGLPERTPDAGRALRASTGLSLADWADLLGIADRQTWARFEAGRTTIALQTWAMAQLVTGRHPRYRVTEA